MATKEELVSLVTAKGDEGERRARAACWGRAGDASGACWRGCLPFLFLTCACVRAQSAKRRRTRCQRTG